VDVPELPDCTLAVCHDVPVLADGTADRNYNSDPTLHSYYRERHTVSRRYDSRHHRREGRMKPTALVKHIRILRQHAETIAARCKAIEDAMLRGEMWGLPIPEGKIERQIRDIETRLLDAAMMIGVRYEGKQTKGGAA
jgi:hypothetical protein